MATVDFLENIKAYTKTSLIAALNEIRDRGWVPNARHGNAGGVGNTLEDILGITENNLPLPNAAEWELKCQRAKTSSLTTLLHCEPSPKAMKLVPSLLLPKYGWAHKEAGKKYPITEMSFRQTINALGRTDRGFGVKINNEDRKFEISFDSNSVSDKHADWLKSVEQRVGLNELYPQPYWGFDDIFHSIAAKLHNCFYIKADVKKIEGKEHYHYRQIKMLRNITIARFISAMSKGALLIDFDARTGHNHGTKFRLRQEMLPMLYGEASDI